MFIEIVESVPLGIYFFEKSLPSVGAMEGGFVDVDELLRRLEEKWKRMNSMSEDATWWLNRLKQKQPAF